MTVIKFSMGLLRRDEWRSVNGISTIKNSRSRRSHTIKTFRRIRRGRIQESELTGGDFNRTAENVPTDRRRKVRRKDRKHRARSVRECELKRSVPGLNRIRQNNRRRRRRDQQSF